MDTYDQNIVIYEVILLCELAIIRGGNFFLQGIQLNRKKINDWEQYPFNIESISSLDILEFTSKVTFIVGKNGCGKSTLIEAIAIAAGFNSEGGTKNFNFSTNENSFRIT